MRKYAIAIAAALALSAAALPAEARTSDVPAGKFGILFNFRDLLLDLTPYSDGTQAGAGVKYWLDGQSALRALAGFTFDSYTPAGSATATTSALFSLGAGYEWHPLSAAVSPYVGGFCGASSALEGGETTLGGYAGLMAGAEYRFLKNLSVFGEYQLKLAFSSTELRLSLTDAAAPSYGAVFGLAVYF